MTRIAAASAASFASKGATRSLRHRGRTLALALFALALGACSAESLTEPVPAAEPPSRPTSPTPRNVECIQLMDKCDPTLF